MVPISGAPRPNDTEYPIVTGYVSRPTCYKSTRQYISFFVNRRWVMSRMLTAAVEGAYHSLLLAGRHPLAVVNIQIILLCSDVNVHPAKTEIRFLKERRVFSAILKATRQALLEEPEIPQWQPAQQPAGPTSLDEDLSTIDSVEQDNETVDNTTPNHEIAQPLPLDSPWITVAEEETGTKPPILSRLWQSHVHSVAKSDNLTDMINDTMEAIGDTTETIGDSTETINVINDTAGAIIDITSAIGGSADAIGGPTDAINRVPTFSPDKSGLAPAGTSTSTRRLPHLRVIGQLAQSYIVTEGEDGSMYLIDQHAAHERILLERMVAAMQSRQSMSQLLLTPITLTLVPSELEAIEEHQAQLEQLGFSLAITEESSLEIRAVPSVLVKQMNVRSLHELMVNLTSEESLGHTETWEEQALANVACKAAIKANYFLTVSEMREMIEQLEQTRAPYSCCHGRPTMVHFSLSALARAFERR